MGKPEGEKVGSTEGLVGDMVGEATGIAMGEGLGKSVGEDEGAALGALVTPQNMVSLPHIPEHTHDDETCFISQDLVKRGGNWQ